VEGGRKGYGPRGWEKVWVFEMSTRSREGGMRRGKGREVVRTGESGLERFMNFCKRFLGQGRLVASGKVRAAQGGVFP